MLATPQARDHKGLPSDNFNTANLVRDVMSLLPTPSAADSLGGHLSRSGDRSGELLLAGVAKALTLLPTPRAQIGEKRNQTCWQRPLDEPQNLENALARLPGVPTVLRSDDGNEPSDDQPHGQQSLDEQESA